MQRISITNPQNIIDGTAKKYYFKLRNTGGPKGDKGDKGDTGATGPQGPQGNAATVSVGSTTTLPVGYDATVTNSGSIYNAVLDFGIPQGPQGPQGAKGDKGDTGAKGDTGPRGPQGERGTNATVYVGTTTTTNPGTQARVYNSGTDSNAVLNFEIPRGDVGPQPELVQTTGTSTTKAMSQKATTDALNTKQATISSSNKLSADLVTDTSTTNKFVTSEDKTTWNAKQNALTAGQGIDITSDVISTPALVPEVVASLPAEGAEGKLYLTPKAHTTSTATGNPITATVAEDAGVIESFQLDGDTFQQTYSGAQMLKKQGMATPTSDTNYWSSFTNLTQTPESNGWAKLEKTTTNNFANFNTSIHSVDITGGQTYTAIVEVKNSTFTSGQMVFAQTGQTQDPVSSYTIVHGCDFTNESSMGIYLASVTSPNVYTFVAKSSFTRGLRYYIQTATTGRVEVRATVLAGDHSSDWQNYCGDNWQPYVGGVASPNPDYPQPIQTVTGLQTVEIVGKNLFDDSVAPASDALTTAGVSWSREDDGSIHTSGTNSGAYRFIRYEITLPAGSYWFGGCPSGGSTDGYSMVIQTDYSDPSTIKFDTGSGNTFTLAQQTTIQVFPIRIGSQTVNMDGKVFKPIIVAGSMASDYIPYSEQMYQLDLGDIELNNLDDTYVDYIWKDGEEWKVHKGIGKYTFANASGFTWGADRNRLYISPTTLAGLGINFVPPASQTSEFYALSDKFKAEVFSTGYADSYTGACFICSSGMTWSFRGGWSNGTEAMSAFADTTVYYALATPTDTTITDTTLISQLEAIRTASLENGTNTITNSTPTPNLAGNMKIGYYGYNPTNRYDKFIWLDLNNAYEQLNNPDTSSTLSTLSTRSLGTTTEQPTVTRSLETETITLKKGETEPVEDKTELPTILDEETETTEPEESDGTDERQLWKQS